MAEEKPDKESQIHEATPHRVSKAIEKGNLPFSREVILLGAIASYTIIIFFAISPSIIKLVYILKNIWQHVEDWHINSSEDIGELLKIIFVKIGIGFSPIFIILIVASFSSSMLQNVPRFVLERIKPKFSNISISSGFKRIYSKRGFIEFLKTSAKLIGVTILVYFAIFKNKDLFINAFMYNQASLPVYIKDHLSKLVVTILIYITIIAAFDIVWSRVKWRRDLRMSHQELKDEHKQIEGDPMLKARMRSLARSRSQNRMLQKVPQASVIITNPTHFSIALRYSPPQDIAPVVIAKGQDLIALKIREIAKEHNIEIIENVELARSLYKKVEIDQIIPEEFYYSVAEIIRYINQQHK